MFPMSRLVRSTRAFCSWGNTAITTAEAMRPRMTSTTMISISVMPRGARRPLSLRFME
jgi:hypothetical protein